MATTPTRVILRYSTSSSSVPDPVSLELGELAINVADERIFFKSPEGDLISRDLDPTSAIANYFSTEFDSKLVDRFEIDPEGNLFVYYSNFPTPTNLGNVIGPPGQGIRFAGVVDYEDDLPTYSELPVNLRYQGVTYGVRLGEGASGPAYPPEEGSHLFVGTFDGETVTWNDLGSAVEGPVGATGATGPAGPNSLSRPAEIPGATGISNIVQISQEDYDALAIVDPSVLYIIIA